MGDKKRSNLESGKRARTEIGIVLIQLARCMREMEYPQKLGRHEMGIWTVRTANWAWLLDENPKDPFWGSIVLRIGMLRLCSNGKFNVCYCHLSIGSNNTGVISIYYFGFLRSVVWVSNPEFLADRGTFYDHFLSDLMRMRAISTFLQI